MEIGAQMYTLRMYTQNETDLGRTLEKVAQIGYRTVQLSGIGPVEPRRVRQLCDDNGLKIVLTHSGEQEFLCRTEALIEKHRIYGCRYVGLGSMADRYRTGVWADHFALDFEKPAKKLHDAGMLMMYHNHAFEFTRLQDGRTIMEHVLDALPKDILGVTADTYWLQYAGVDVAAWLRAHAERLHCVHLKDMTPHFFENRMAAVGRGNMNFPDILCLLRENGVTEYALVEQDDCYGESPFDCLKQSYDYLKEMGC